MNKNWTEILRGLLADSKGMDQHTVSKNYNALKYGKLIVDDQDVVQLLERIEDFRKAHSSSPTVDRWMDTLRVDPPSVEALMAAEGVIKAQVWDGANYADVVRAEREIQQGNIAVGNLQMAQEILKRTKADSERILRKTPRDPLAKLYGLCGYKEYLLGAVGDMETTSVVAAKTTADLSDARDQDWFLADSAKENVAYKTWITELDAKRGGVRHNEIIAVLGFAGHGKSTLTRYLCYTQVVTGGRSVVFVSVEEPLEDTMLYFYLLHANNPNLRHICFDNPILADGRYCGTITADAFRNNDLSEGQLEYLTEAMKDFSNNRGKLYVVAEAGLTVPQLQGRLLQIENKFRLTGHSIDVLCVDYPGILSVTGQAARYDNPNAREDAIWMELANLSKTYDFGRGFTLIAPHQSNRSGYKEAKKAGGFQDATAISGAHNVERFANLVLSILPVDESQTGRVRQVKLQSLKSRGSARLRDSILDIDGATGWVSDSTSIPAEQVIDDYLLEAMRHE